MTALGRPNCVVSSKGWTKLSVTGQPLDPYEQNLPFAPLRQHWLTEKALETWAIRLNARELVMAMLSQVPEFKKIIDAFRRGDFSFGDDFNSNDLQTNDERRTTKTSNSSGRLLQRMF